MKNVISTFSGKKFNVFSPNAEQIDICDIAHALSLLCRANGHFNRFYSVAGHSINCYKEALSRNLPLNVQKCCLLHDASEAYMNDVPRPVKTETYIEKEKVLQAAILKKLAPDIAVSFFDDRALWREIDDTLLYYEFETYFKTQKKMNPIPDKGYRLHIVLSETVKPFEFVEAEYLSIYEDLIKKETV